MRNGRGIQRTFGATLLLALFAAACSPMAHAGKVALLLEQPYGKLGTVDPLGHAAIYLSDVCAETPVLLRRCDPGETGVVLSRYHHIDRYDWVAMPLLAYLYAVGKSYEIPENANRSMVTRLRDEYRRTYLLNYVPDDPRREIPAGDWTQLVGESYDRKIYGFELPTTPGQDDALIAMLNGRQNRSRYEFFFRNCANFAESILNFYYPHSIHRNFVSDAGFMTPKQTAHSLEKYAKRHPDLEFTTFEVPQVPGSIHRSTAVHGVLEGLLETKKYAVPLAILHPEIAGGMLAVYIGDGRFHPDAQMDGIFDPRKQHEPGIADPATIDTAKTQVKTNTVAEATPRDAEMHPAE